MSNQPSPFIWYELMTTDTVAAQAFYRAIIGWGARDAGAPEGGYTLFTIGEVGVSGMLAIPEHACEAGARPGWSGYIGVDDADATAAQIEQKGGSIHRAPDDIPGVGRFAVVADPHGAVFMIMKPIGEAPAESPSPTQCGTVGWRELHAGNGPEAFEFYSGLFGWQKTDAMDMGPLGVYQLFGAGSESVGAMMTKMEDTPAPLWLYYFNVDNIETATARVKENHGQIVMGPHEVPGGSWIVQCLDPQGAMFALVAPGQ